MIAYIIRRLLLMIPTLIGIMIVNFFIVQFAPGGPVEQLVTQMTGSDVGATSRIGGGGEGETAAAMDMGSVAATAMSEYRGAQGLDPEFIKELERQFGFDLPLHERFLLMMGNYIRFDFGHSYFRDETVVNLVISKMPVSISLGLWTTLIVYVVSIPLGIRKAVHDGSFFDVWSSTLITVAYAIPGFLFAVMLIVLFAGGSFLDWFPLRGLTSEGWDLMSWPERVMDYFWHLVLPIIALVMHGFATLTFLTKNSFLDQVHMLYVWTARAKGLTEGRVLYGHVFRNAMLLVIAGFPSAFIHILFTGALLIEVIFSLDGLGLLGFEAVVKRDYPVMFATLYFFTLLGLVLHLIGDIVYTMVDPRIDFERKNA